MEIRNLSEEKFRKLRDFFKGRGFNRSHRKPNLYMKEDISPSGISTMTFVDVWKMSVYAYSENQSVDVPIKYKNIVSQLKAELDERQTKWF